MFFQKFAFAGVLLCAVVLAGAATRTERTFAPGWQASSWPTADGFSGTHYSPLRDITAETVEYLEVAWTYRTGDVHAHADGMAGTAFEATPIMVDGVLYVATPYSRAVALDAETGKELWAFDPGLDRTDESHTMVTSRGLSYWADPERESGQECAARIVHASFDARLFALDAKTGLICSDFANGVGIDLGMGIARLEGRRHQFNHTAPPALINDIVVVGSSIWDGHFADGPSGAVRAFDVRTGALRWTWEPLVGVEGTLPNGDRIDAGAANTWATITPDPEHDLVFVPTGSPSPDHFGGLRPGDNRYGNLLVALRASTGEVVWHFQMVHHDLWDYDLPSPPALITLERDGEPVPAVVRARRWDACSYSTASQLNRSSHDRCPEPTFRKRSWPRHSRCRSRRSRQGGLEVLNHSPEAHPVCREARAPALPIRASVHTAAAVYAACCRPALGGSRLAGPARHDEGRRRRRRTRRHAFEPWGLRHRLRVTLTHDGHAGR